MKFAHGLIAAVPLYLIAMHPHLAVTVLAGGLAIWVLRTAFIERIS